MSFVSRLFGGAPARSAQSGRVEPAFSRDGDASSNAFLEGRDYSWSSPSATGIQINQHTALQVSTVMSCVSILSEDVGKLKPEIYKMRSDGGRDIAKNHWLRPLLSRPNDWQTWIEFCMMMMAALMLRGNAYAVILRNGRGIPYMLVPINPDRVSLWEAPDGNLFFVVTRCGLHEMAVLKDVPLFVPFEDVFHWKGLSGNGLLGVSKIALCREAIGLASGLEQRAARALGIGSGLSGIFETPAGTKLDDVAIKRMGQRFAESYGGLSNNSKPMILEPGITWKPLGVTFADMEFMAARAYQNEDIARIWRIPPHMIGVMTKSTGNSMSQLSQDYLNNTLMTYKDIIEQRFAFTFDLGPDYIVDLDVSKILRADIQARYAAYRIGSQSWLTPNEIRIAEGMNPDPEPGADKLWRPVNLAPIDSDVFEANSLPGEGDEPAGLGSDQTGGGAEGGGRPPADGSDPAPSD